MELGESDIILIAGLLDKVEGATFHLSPAEMVKFLKSVEWLARFKMALEKQIHEDKIREAERKDKRLKPNPNGIKKKPKDSKPKG